MFFSLPFYLTLFSCRNEMEYRLGTSIAVILEIIEYITSEIEKKLTAHFFAMWTFSRVLLHGHTFLTNQPIRFLPGKLVVRNVNSVPLFPLQVVNFFICQGSTWLLFRCLFWGDLVKRIIKKIMEDRLLKCPKQVDAENVIGVCSVC